MTTTVPINELTTEPPFDALFAIQPGRLAEIVEAMRDAGFDEARPLDVWRRGDADVVIDGHTRLQAAREIGLERVPVVFHEFASEDEAVEYTIRAQMLRRNLTGKELVKFLLALGERLGRGRPMKNGSTDPLNASNVADMVHASVVTIKRIYFVFDHGPANIKSGLKDGLLSPWAAYQKTRDFLDEQARQAGESTGQQQNGGKGKGSGKSCKSGQGSKGGKGRKKKEEGSTTQTQQQSASDESTSTPSDVASGTEAATSGSKAEGDPTSNGSTTPEGAKGFENTATATGDPFVLNGSPIPAGNSKFNYTNDMVDWARWTWNPVTGCEHNCIYCYARDIANRFYPEKFKPTFHPERLSAPHNTSFPREKIRQLVTERDEAIARGDQASVDRLNTSILGERNVFTCSMADLFGRWVPDAWIEAVLEQVRLESQWNYLFLTKFPLRYEGIDFPENAWVGTTVDEQKRVASAEKAFRNVKASVKWLSCEPFREDLTFKSLEMFDWVVIGGQSESTQAPAFQPPWEWIEHLWEQARAAGCRIYWKPNLTTRPKEYPSVLVDKNIH
jgi:protein gp37